MPDVNVMLDLETMDSAPSAAIVAIGAVVFTDDGLGETFYTNVDLASSMLYGGTVSGDTVMWWLRQSQEARDALGKTGDVYQRPVALDVVLLRFAGWLGKVSTHPNDIRMWGNGATFNNVVLSEAYRRLDTMTRRPWSYRNDRCYRTIAALCPDVPFERVGTSHNALDDAKSQALHLIQCLKRLRQEGAR